MVYSPLNITAKTLSEKDKEKSALREEPNQINVILLLAAKLSTVCIVYKQ